MNKKILSKAIKEIFILVSFASILTNCINKYDKTNDFPKWYSGSDVITKYGEIDFDAIDPDKIDLIYLVSTEVMAAEDEQGQKLYQTNFTDQDMANIDGEIAYAQNYYSQGDFNFFSPYYKQFTFEAINLPKQSFDSVYSLVKTEANAIFDYYISKVNQGRKFALVGFSQGAMLVLDILKHADKSQLQNMVGAYMVGYGLSKEDLECENIVPATGEKGFGQTISFNSVMDKEATWPTVYNNSVVCINPANWRTDSTPATFAFGEEEITVALDTEINELIVTVPNKTPYHEFMESNPAYKMAGVNADCLHRWDLLYYTDFIHDNILVRGK